MSHLVISSTTKMMVGSDSPHRLLGYLLHQILPVTLEIWWSANPGYSKAPRFLVVKFLKSPFRPPNIHMPKSFHAKSTPKFHISTCFQIFPYINIFQLFFKIPTHLFPLFFHVAAPRVCSTQVSVSELPKVEALGIELRQTSGYAAPVNVQTGELVRRAVQKRLGRWWEKWIYPLVN